VISELTETVFGSSGQWRENASNRLVMSAARAVACNAALTSRCRSSSAPLVSRRWRVSRFAEIAVDRLLKSWATPPTSWRRTPSSALGALARRDRAKRRYWQTLRRTSLAPGVRNPHNRGSDLPWATTHRAQRRDAAQPHRSAARLAGATQCSRYQVKCGFQLR
jgi:hypothetical protein